MKAGRTCYSSEAVRGRRRRRVAERRQGADPGGDDGKHLSPRLETSGISS